MTKGTVNVPATRADREGTGSNPRPGRRTGSVTARALAGGASLPRAALARPGQRAGLVAAIWIVFYLAFSVPVVAAGVATTHFGLHQTAVVYSAALAVLAATAAGSFLYRRRSQSRGLR
jgi:hypothetical protein